MANESSVMFKIVEEGVTLSTSKSGWKTALRKVAWGDGAPKWDLRAWSADDTRCGKGITLTSEELQALGDYITSIKEEA